MADEGEYIVPKYYCFGGKTCVAGEINNIICSPIKEKLVLLLVELLKL